MLTFTAPDDSKVTIDPVRVVRARRTVSGENRDGANTRIDWVEVQFVQEPIEDVAAQIKNAVQEFTAVTSKDGSRIWFNAKQAVGPLTITPSQAVDGVRSSLKIMGYKQFVTETPDEVRAIISAAGGSPV
jgi:hypothetical protein